MGFGRRVIGDQAWAAQEAVAKTARANSGFGPRVTGAPKEPVAEAVVTTDETTKPETTTDETTKPTETKEAIQLTVKDLGARLQEDTSILVFDGLADAEFARVEGPRKGGLRLLLKAEEDRGEPREAVVLELKKALKI